MRVSRYDAVVFDVDGTLVWGESAIDGAVEAVAAARERGPVAFVSNNPTAAPAEYADRLSRVGVDAEPSAVVTAGSVTARVVADGHPEPVYVVGEAGLVARLHDRGVRTTETPAAAGTVVASIDRSLEYGDLAAALRAFEVGDPAFVGTDPDPVIPGEDGLVPGSGAVVDAVASVAGRRPDAMAGKPSRAAWAATVAALGGEPTRALVVGDRPGTDVALGPRAGPDVETALVLSGVTDAGDVPEDGPDGPPAPDHVVDSVAELPALLADEADESPNL
ncbi:HAD family hydrolase [Halobacteriales archaeon SW_5_70_135]|nr:MAG: HAD family hydrolase [Halobacteriales archaeon SW_5_70_135]